MASTTHREAIAAPADAVWNLVGSFGDSSWMGGIEMTVEGDGLGAVRKVSMPTGVATELCEVLEPETRTIGYAILDGNPFPATDYHGTITVESVDDASCELVWSARYEPAGDAEALDADIARFLKGGVAHREAVRRVITSGRLRTTPRAAEPPPRRRTPRGRVLPGSGPTR